MNNENHNDKTLDDVEQTYAAPDSGSDLDPGQSPTPTQVIPKSSKTAKKWLLAVFAVVVVLFVSGYLWSVTRNESRRLDSATDSAPTSQSATASPFKSDGKDLSIVYTVENKTYLFDARKKQNEVVIEYPSGNSSSVERVRTVSVDPTGKTIVFAHSAESDGQLNKFSYYKTRLSMYDIASKKVTPIIENADQSVTHFNWSPDGSCYSYILNDGQSAVVRDVSGKVITTIEGGLIQPIIWVDQETISFIQNETLYKGTLSQPKAKAAVTDALVNLGGFESPGRMKTPLWNGDYLAYESNRGHLVVVNTASGGEKLLGTLSTKSCFDIDCTDGTEDAYPFGWLDTNRLLFGIRMNGFSGGTIHKTYSTTDQKIETVMESKDFVALYLIDGMGITLQRTDNLAGGASPSNAGKKQQLGIQTSTIEQTRLSQKCTYQSTFVDKDRYNTGYPDTKASYYLNVAEHTKAGIVLLDIGRNASNGAYQQEVTRRKSLELINAADCSYITSVEVPLTN